MGTRISLGRIEDEFANTLGFDRRVNRLFCIVRVRLPAVKGPRVERKSSVLTSGEIERML